MVPAETDVNEHLVTIEEPPSATDQHQELSAPADRHLDLSVPTDLHQEPSETTHDLGESNLSPHEESSSSVDSLNDIEISNDAKGGQDLPCSGPHCMYLSVDQVISELKNASSIHEYVPLGIKSNQFFVVNNSYNEGKSKGTYWDDCGAWGPGGPTTHTTFLLNNEGDFKTVVKDKETGLWGIKKQKRGTKLVEPIEPQPDPAFMFTVHRRYNQQLTQITTNEGDTIHSRFERRISWVTGLESELPSAAIYEYKGIQPENPRLHGNAKKTSKPYLKSLPIQMQQINSKARFMKPSQLYRDQLMVSDDSNPLNVPRDLKQVKNARYRQKKLHNGGQSTGGNYASQMANIIHACSLDSNDFVQLVTHTKDKKPQILCYNEDQITDLKRCCCNSGENNTVMSIDKTFNLTSMHVSTIVYKNIAVVNESGENPIFPGPILLHSNSDFQTYNGFLAHVAGRLEDGISRPMGGSDGEKAIKKAWKQNFGDDRHVNCIKQHFKKNANQYLTDKVGMNVSDRNIIITSIYGPNGLSSALDDVVFEIRLKQLEQICSTLGFRE